MKKETTHNVAELSNQGSVQTVEEFDAVIELLKVQNPTAYEQQLGNGEIDRMRATMKDFKKEVKVDMKK